MLSREKREERTSRRRVSAGGRLLSGVFEKGVTSARPSRIKAAAFCTVAAPDCNLRTERRNGAECHDVRPREKPEKSGHEAAGIRARCESGRRGRSRALHGLSLETNSARPSSRPVSFQAGFACSQFYFSSFSARSHPILMRFLCSEIGTFTRLD